MDFMLPNDKTMKRMAKEYAKIKKVGVEPKAVAFSVDENNLEKAQSDQSTKEREQDKR